MKPQRRILLKAVVLVLLAVCLSLWIIHRRGKNELEDYKRQLVAAGEKLTVEELAPKVTLEGKNAAALFSGITSKLPSFGVISTNPPSMRMVAFGRASAACQQPDIRDGYATNSWADIRSALEAEESLLNGLHQFLESPVMEEDLDYASGFKISMPPLAQRKEAIRHLAAAVDLNLRDGNADLAVTNARTMLALVKSFSGERLIISQLVGIAVTAISFNASWDVLQSSDVKDDQLASLQHDWEALDIAVPMERAMEMERAMGIIAADEMRKSGQEFANLTATWLPAGGGTISDDDSFKAKVLEYTKETFDRSKAKAKHLTWRTVWADKDQLKALKGMQALLGSLREVSKTGVYLPAFKARNDELQRLGIMTDSGDGNLLVGGDGGLQSLLSGTIIGALHKFQGRAFRAEAGRRLTVAAIALKRFQLRNKNLPLSLSELSPEFVSSIPLDPADGQPLRYRRNDDGTFLLYSIGEDGVDDGGNPKPANEGARARAWQNGRDWVFPQPASEEQIADYYKELTKNR